MFEKIPKMMGNYLVVEPTHLKKISQNGLFPQVGLKIKNIWNPQNDGKYCWWTKSCTTKDDDYPIIYRVLTIPGSAGSTVLGPILFPYHYHYHKNP